MRTNIPLVANKNMEIYPGELRFCEDCIHRIIVNGLQNDEIRCERHGILLKSGSEANQCFMSNDFEETAMAKENRKDFPIGDFDNLVLS
jgi:hypothetical protein